MKVKFEDKIISSFICCHFLTFFWSDKDQNTKLIYIYLTVLKCVDIFDHFQLVYKYLSLFYPEIKSFMFLSCFALHVEP